MKDGTNDPSPLLVDSLWHLKREHERVYPGEIALSRLINDPEYLDSILQRASASGDAALINAAQRARMLKDTDWVDVTHALEMGRPVSGDAFATGPKSSAASSSARPGISTLFAVVLFVVVAGAAGSLIRSTSKDSEKPGSSVAPANRSEAAPASASGSPEIELRIHGSNTVGEKLTPKLVDAFLRSKNARDIRVVSGEIAEEKLIVATVPGKPHPVAIEIHAHGSSTAFKDLLSGNTDIGQSSRQIKSEELAALRERHGDLATPASEHVIALDGLAILVHPGNPVPSLTVEQVARLFAGQITDWAGVGGDPGPVHLHARDDKSGTFDTFKSLVLDSNKLPLAGWAERYESSGDLSDRVAADPHAVGFAGIAYVKNSKLVAIAATAETMPILPTRFTLATEDYPLSRRLYLYMPLQGGNAMARELVQFALAPAGQDIVTDVGFISQAVYASREPAGKNAPADYREIAERAERLSVNFRFRAGEEVLDSKAMRDLDRLTRFLGDNPDRDVLLLGFTDSLGDAGRNLELSERRAQVIERELRARGVRPKTVRGFGEAIALASNDSDIGRQRNRRVEAWVQ